MPELPEVQTVADNLAAKIIGKVFNDAQVKVTKMVTPRFKGEIKQAKIRNIFRRAKMIVIELSGGKYLAVHLKMTGQLIYVDKKGRASGGGHPIDSRGIDLASPNRFTHIILYFTDDSRLLFHDVRKFGWMKILSADEFIKASERLGIEPLSKKFTPESFEQILKKRPKLKIKQLLMNQELIAGIGNIYADESLFEAKINPLRPADSLKEAEIKKLYKAIISKLKQAVELGGTSVNTFVNVEGERGRFVEKLKVYGRGGQPCLRCKSKLKKIKLAGRGTVYCSQCQK